MNKLFATYAGLYPGKEDVILAAMDRGEKEAAAKGLTGKAYMDEVESEILDVL